MDNQKIKIKTEGGYTKVYVGDTQINQYDTPKMVYRSTIILYKHNLYKNKGFTIKYIIPIVYTV